MNNKLKIIFLGTPEFAVPSLKKLIASEFKPELIITQPDKPVGRHQELKPPPIKEVALSNNLEIWQPESLKDISPSTPSGRSGSAKKFDCDLAIVVAYGKIIPEEILKLPRLGFINIPTFLIFIPITTFMAKIGAETVHKFNKGLIGKIFGIYLLIIASKLFYDYFTF